MKETAWIQTRNTAFSFINHTIDEIILDDISHALSFQCRYTGHVNQFYSVAEHSIHCCHMALEKYGLKTARTALMHDATEAYVGDVSKPLKMLLPQFNAIENHIWHSIAERFDLYHEIPKIVKEIDLIMLLNEKDQIFNTKLDWELPHKQFEEVKLYYYNPEDAKLKFNKLAEKLEIK